MAAQKRPRAKDAKDATTKKVRRLAPKPEVLRELYLLSGNNCAMPDCIEAIIDAKGVVVGHICHIEAAMPDGPRFNRDQSNDDRRQLANLVLMCGGHHTQIDSKQHEAEWPVDRVRAMKDAHESQFRAVGDSLKRRFIQDFSDSTKALVPTSPGKFTAFDRLMPKWAVTGRDRAAREEDFTRYIAKLRVVPDAERRFMLAIVDRAATLGHKHDMPAVHVADAQSAHGLSDKQIKAYGDALERYDIGGVFEMSVGDRDDYHVVISNPSDYLDWGGIEKFCKKAGLSLREIIIDLKFGLLD